MKLRSPVRRYRGWHLALLAFCGFANAASAGTLSFGGTIYQSTADGTGPAENNPTLKNISDGDVYSVTIAFAGALTAPGAYDPLKTATVVFLDSTASVSENSFANVSLTISPAGTLLDVSILGCLSTGSGCQFGNQLAAEFAIPVASWSSQDSAAQSIPALTPLDLLEDDGNTDIQGTVTAYSYSGSANPSSVPEPDSIVTMGLASIILITWRRKSNSRYQKEKNL